MSIKESYNAWAGSYDSVINKTRDLEAYAIRSVLKDFQVEHALELGAGTGKNTGFISSISKQVHAADFSDEMVKNALAKNHEGNITFLKADISLQWPFEDNIFDLVSTSLVLEHIRDLHFIFSEASRVIGTGGFFYIGELHPFKQYLGTKARFETDGSTHTLDCYTHHMSEFFACAAANGFSLMNLNEWFDEDEKTLPRVISLLFQKMENEK